MLNLGGPLAKPEASARRDRSVDHYLHGLLLLTTQGGQVDTGELACHVGVSGAAASRMLKNLAKKKLVRLIPYQGSSLTSAGLVRALRIVRRHRLLEVFLHRVMGFELRDAHQRAFVLQPAVDEEFEEKLDVMLGHPTIDPHGQPIPSKQATWPKLTDAPLLELHPGAKVRVSRVVSEDSEAIGYLDALGIRTDSEIELVSVAPFDGPTTVCIDGKVIHLGRRLAQLICIGKAARDPVPRKSKERAATGGAVLRLASARKSTKTTGRKASSRARSQ